MTGQTVSPIWIIGKLGGGMGFDYKVRDTHFGWCRNASAKGSEP